MAYSKLKKISIEGYKRFNEKVSISVDNVSYMIGANNSGKTSIIQLILILKEHFESNSFDTLSLLGKYFNNHHQAILSQIFNNKSDKNKIVIWLDLLFHPNDFDGDRNAVNYQIEIIFDNFGNENLNGSKATLQNLTLYKLATSDKFDYENPLLFLERVIEYPNEPLLTGHSYKIKIDTEFYLYFNFFAEFDDVIDTWTSKIKSNNLISDINKTNYIKELNSLRSRNLVNTNISNHKGENYTSFVYHLPSTIHQFSKSFIEELLQLYRNRFKEISKELNMLPNFEDYIFEDYIFEDKNTEGNDFEDKYPNLDYSKSLLGLFDFTDNIKLLSISRTLNNNSFNLQDNSEWNRCIRRIVSKRYKHGAIISNIKLEKIFSKLYFQTELSEDDLNKNLFQRYKEVEDPIGESLEYQEFLERFLLKDNEYTVNVLSLVSYKLNDGNGITLYLNNIPIQQFGNGFKQLILIYLSVLSILDDQKDKDRKKFDYFTSGEKTTFIIEEPEIFLHPNYQAKLADLFYELSEQFKIRFILETHSEYLLRRTQVIVKNNPKYSNKISIMYFESQMPTIRAIGFNKTGFLTSDFGVGFYDETTRSVLDLYNNPN